MCARWRQVFLVPGQARGRVLHVKCLAHLPSTSCPVLHHSISMTHPSLQTAVSRSSALVRTSRITWWQTTAAKKLPAAHRSSFLHSSVHAAAGAQGAVAAMAAADQTEYSSRWEDQFWGKEGGLKPGEAFDAGRPSPALSDLLTSGRLDAAGKRVLIPGCGRGYDVIEFLRARAAAAVGLELAPTAAMQAKEYLASQLAADEEAKAEVFAGDFFKWEHPTVASFDIGYDYTFMCALHPDMRKDWAAAWARYLHSGARLACLVFPIDPERQTGPPWPVTPEIFEELLVPAGFKLESMTPVPPELSHPGRGGKECMGIFVRQ